MGNNSRNGKQLVHRSNIQAVLIDSCIIGCEMNILVYTQLESQSRVNVIIVISKISYGEIVNFQTARSYKSSVRTISLL